MHKRLTKIPYIGEKERAISIPIPVLQEMMYFWPPELFARFAPEEPLPQLKQTTVIRKRWYISGVAQYMHFFEQNTRKNENNKENIEKKTKRSHEEAISKDEKETSFFKSFNNMPNEGKSFAPETLLPSIELESQRKRLAKPEVAQHMHFFEVQESNMNETNKENM